MPESRPDPSTTHRQAIGVAIQDLMVARLGRSFVPLAVVFGLGAIELWRSTGFGAGAILAGGAVVTSAAMLAYGLRVVQYAFGRPERPWMYGALVAGVAPPFFALYLIGWRGLRLVGFGNGLAGIAWASLFVGMGVWVLRSWMKMVEIERLARIMALNLDEDGGQA